MGASYHIGRDNSICSHPDCYSNTCVSVHSAGFSFQKNLIFGDIGPDVLKLQQFLNATPDTAIALTGVGSKGQETNYFGPATKKAVMKFQAKYASAVLAPSGLTTPTGFFGPASRTKANVLFAGSKVGSISTASTPTSNVSTASTTTAIIRRGGGGGGGGSSAPPNTAPSVTVVGTSTISVTAGETYVDLGATASDAEDGNLTASVASSTDLDLNTVGTYTVTYSVTDSKGAHGTATRTVTVTGLPDVASVAAPSDSPALPIAFDTFAAPVSADTPTSTAPAFAEWTKTAKPDDTLAVSGVNLSNFVVYGQRGTSDKTFTGVTVRASTTITSAITLANNLPAWSTYFVWPKNGSTYGRPILVNKTDAWWVGPATSTRSQTVSVYGRNLSHNNGTSESWVYIKPASGAGSWATVLLSLKGKYGTKDITNFDKVCLVLAILSILPWLLTKSVLWSVLLATFIDLIAFFPTMRKTWHAPKSESLGSMYADAVKHALSTVSMGTYSLVTLIYPLSVLATKFVIIGEIVYLRKIKKL